MRLNRGAALTSVCLLSALVLAACGTDNNSMSDGKNAGASTRSSADQSANPGSPAGDPTSGAAGGGGTRPVSITCGKGTLQLAGSTAQTNAMSQWTKAYQNQCPGATINYGGGGSGQGVQNFTDGTIDFAGSDFPLAPGDEQQSADKRCKSGPAIDLPMVPGPIAVGYNLPGVDKLNLSAPVLAKIFSGKVTKWDDSAIKRDNPGVTLPSASIQTFHRSDGSGTSYNFTNYLANDAKSDWSYGANKNWPAPAGVGAKGTAGIAQGVKTTPGGIGYMELSYATLNKISYAKVSNADGDFIALTPQNVANFLAKARVVGKGTDLSLKFDYANSAKDAYPNLLVTYEIVCSAGNPADKLPLLRGFLGYLASGSGQSVLPDNGYVKLPTTLQRKVQQAISTIK